MVAKRCVVSGKVQGVWFRASAKREADRLGITGHARNLADGNVEVLACGEADAVAMLIEWLHAGPPQAQVESVVVADADDSTPSSAFQIK